MPDEAPPPEIETIRSAVPGTEPARSLGPYQLLQRLGEGGMGEVWVADQRTPIRRTVAIKFVKAGYNSREVMSRFLAERQALALMDHPAVAKIFEAGEDETGRPYFVMEYVPGLPITSHCDRHHLTMAERLELFLLVCDGVHHAHQKAVIHRDLKPSNLLVALEGRTSVPKIIDFGLAKAIGPRLTEQSLYTEMGTMMGTLEYMSPEQADLCGQDVDIRTDVYALGMVLYELLTGTLPYNWQELRRSGLEAILRTIREVEPPRPSVRLSRLKSDLDRIALARRTQPPRLVRELRGDLTAILVKALDKDRVHRYGSVSELAADIRRYLQHQPVTATPPSVVYRARKFARRNRAAVAAASLIFAALLLGMGGAAVGLRRAERAEEAAKMEAAKATAINAFLLDTLGAANPVGGVGRSVTVVEALRRAEGKLAEAFAGQPAVEIDVRSSIGVTYERLGFYADAERLLRSALEACRREPSCTKKQSLHLESNLAVALLDQHKLAEAEHLYREILEAADGVLDPAEVMSAKSNLALVFYERGDYPAAEALYHEVIESDRRTLRPDSPDLAASINNLARVLRARGRIDEALPLYREAEGIMARAQFPFRAITLGNIGQLECERGNLDRALEAFRQGLAIGAQALGEGHADVLQVQAKYGVCLRDTRQYEAAEEVLLKALEGFRATEGTEEFAQRVAADLVVLYEKWGKPDRQRALGGVPPAKGPAKR